MKYNNLEATLHARLATAIAPATDLIKYPNIQYDDVQETAIWLRPMVLFGTAQSATLGGDGLNIVNGIYQVSVFTARGIGTESSNNYVEQVLDSFTKGERLIFTGGVIILGVGYQSTNMQEDAFLHTPITIPFTAHMEI